MLEQLAPVMGTVSSVIVITQSADDRAIDLVTALQERRVAARLLRVHDDSGPAWLARRRKLLPARSDAEEVVRATRIAGEEPIVL
jgi:hypothetical protein